MKIFYGGIFVKKESLVEAGINHPIKLEYYKIINEDELNKNNATKFGINIIKTEYIKENTKVEEKSIKYISNDEQKINEILDVLKQNKVTPISLEDIIIDFSKQILFL